MSDARDTLLKQIAEWEAAAQEARDVLRFAERILPGLREVAGLAPSSADDPESCDSQEPERAPELTDDEGNEDEPLEKVKASDDVKTIVHAVLDRLPTKFKHADVSEAFAALGMTANRSTLSANLLEMARAEDGFLIESMGKGRKPTVFRKVGP